MDAREKIHILNQQLLNINTIISPNTYNTNNGKIVNLALVPNAIVANEPNIVYENINTQDRDNSSQINLALINSIINGDTRSTARMKYKITRYLGRGIRGNLFLAIDSAGNRVICKELKMPESNNSTMEHNTSRQLEFELGILKYLSNNAVAREHINPCLDYTIHDNTVYTIFPVFKGYSLSHFYNYLSRSSANDYYKILFFLIKSLLHALSKIHETGIAHQNINENSILVSTFIDQHDIKIKFTDFGLGCGNGNSQVSGNIIPVDDYINEQQKSSLKSDSVASCRVNCNAPVIFTPKVLGRLKESDFLRVAQKYDVLCIGLIAIKYLLYFEPLFKTIDLSQPVDNLDLEKIRDMLVSKYSAKAKPALSILEVSSDIKKVILAYVRMITRFMLCPTLMRKPAQYVLDKIIIYEKYKNDIF